MPDEIKQCVICGAGTEFLAHAPDLCLACGDSIQSSPAGLRTVAGMIGKLKKHAIAQAEEKKLLQEEMDKKNMAASAALTDVWNHVFPDGCLGEWEYPAQASRMIKEIINEKEAQKTPRYLYWDTSKQASPTFAKELSEVVKLDCTSSNTIIVDLLMGTVQFGNVVKHVDRAE